MDRVVIRTSRGKMAAVLVGSLMFVALGAAVATGVIEGGDPAANPDLDPEEAAAVGLVIGGLCAGFFGLIALYSFARLIRPAAAVEMDADGLVLRGAVGTVDRIRWDEIADLSSFSIRGATFLGIMLKDEASYRRRQSRWARILSRANKLVGGAPLAVPGSVGDRSLSEIDALIRAFMARYGGAD